MNQIVERRPKRGQQISNKRCQNDKKFIKIEKKKIQMNRYKKRREASECRMMKILRMKWKM